jgi:hypothetical protein
VEEFGMTINAREKWEGSRGDSPKIFFDEMIFESPLLPSPPIQSKTNVIPNESTSRYFSKALDIRWMNEGSQNHQNCCH